MSILSSFKKALGFPDEYDEEPEAVEISQDVSPATSTSNGGSYSVSVPRQTNAATTATNAPAPLTNPDSLLSDPELPAEVLDAVIEQFNTTQPDFVRDCLSLPEQREYLIQRMSDSLRLKLKTEAENARKAGLLQCENERAKMARDIEKFKSERASINRQKEEFKNAELSATRQKRALNDRIRDLEQQVAQLEAEKEQFQLENRGLINKLRVADVRSGMSGDSDTDADRLAQENIILADRVKDLELQLQEKEKTLREAEEAAKETPTELPQEMIDEIEQKLSELEQINAKKGERINLLNRENSELKSNVEQLRATVSRLEKAADHSQEIAEKNQEIEALKSEVKRLTEMVNASEAPTPHRKKKRNHKSESHTEFTEVKQEEVTVDMELNEPEQSELQPVEKPKISAIDELMDSTDWFTAPDPVPLKKDPEVDELFGYKEPQRKPTHDDDKQLSLF